jgi:hypothetical protein
MGPTEIIVTLKDELNFTSNHTFTVTVYSPPKIKGSLIQQDIAILSYSNYTLSVENTNYAVLLAENPRFVEF